MRDEARQLSEAFMLGHNHFSRYLDLESWTRAARSFSAAMLCCNTIDDLLIAWAAAIEGWRKHAQGAQE